MRHKYTVPLFLALVSLSACGGGGGGSGSTVVTPPPPPPVVRTPQSVVFIAEEPNLMQRHVFSASDEGSALLRLSPDFANGNGNVTIIAVSPDRQNVAYAADADAGNTFEVYVVPIGGGTATRVSSSFPAGTVIGQIAWSPDSSQIAYVANPMGNAPRGFRLWEVFLADQDGSNHRKINGSVGSPPVVSVSLIKWSPDSRYLAQTVLSLDPFQTVIGLNTYDSMLGTPNSRRITPTHDYLNGERMGFDYEWSEDSALVAYRSSFQTAGITELYAVAPDGSGNTKLSGALVSGGDVDVFRWAPDSSRIAYLADQQVDNRFDLFVSNADGTNNLRINDGGTLSFVLGNLFQWSPDGSQIVYSRDQDITGVNEVYAGNADGSGSVKLHPSLSAGQFAVDPQWSADGQQVLYRSNQEDVNTPGFYVSNATGSGSHLVSGPLVQNGSVSLAKWSPDGSRVAYTSRQDNATRRELYVSTADGLTNTRVNADITAVDVDIDGFRFNWSTDSTRVVFQDRFADFFLPETLDLWIGTTDGAAPVMLNDTNDFLGVVDY